VEVVGSSVYAFFSMRMIFQGRRVEVVHFVSFNFTT